MPSFPPRLPWNELYVRSGLKSLSDRVRVQPVVRRMRSAARELKSTVLQVAQERVPIATAETWVRRVLAEEFTGPATVINATGVIAPTGLTLPMADSAIAAMSAAQSHYTRPNAAVESLLCDATGAEAALLFHSTAAAATAALAVVGGKAIVAREHVGMVGEGLSLIESAAAAGVRLNEVGLPGGCSLDDYRRAVDAPGGCVWFAVPQSWHVAGEHPSADREEVFALARDRGLTSIEFMEAALLQSLASPGSSAVPVVGEALIAGADLVIFPGDRFMGGPACGIAVGRRQLIGQLSEHPLARLSRLDAARSAALAATLELFASNERCCTIPAVQMMTASAENLQHRAERLAVQLSTSGIFSTVQAVACPGFLNHGRLASEAIAGWGVEITPQEGQTVELRHWLQSLTPAVVVSQDAPLVMNLRSVLPRQDEEIRKAFFGAN